MGKYTDAHEMYMREREWLKKPFREMKPNEKRKFVAICIVGFAVMALAVFTPAW